MAADFLALSQEALACRTLGELMVSHNKLMEQASTNYFEGVNKLYGMMFNSWPNVAAPLREYSAAASDKMRKVMARNCRLEMSL